MYTLKVSQFGESSSTSFFINKSICTLGDSEENSVTLKGKKVAKVHAQIEFRDDGIHISNRATFKPLFVNDNKVDNFGPITISDVIVIGDYTINITIADQDPTKKYAPPPAPKDALKKAYRHWQQQTHQLVKQAIKQQGVDLHGDNAISEVGSIVHSVVNGYTDLPTNIDKGKLAHRVQAEIIGFGALEPLMNNPHVTEIMVNAHDEIFYEENGKTQIYGGSFTNSEVLLDVIERMIAPTGRRLDKRSPMIDARLKDGSRINAIIPPLAVKGPSLTIRKMNNERLTAQHLINYETLSPEMIRFLEMAVIHKCNIIISGSTGSGKSTLLNVLSGFIPNKERVIVIEDAAELELLQPNLVSLEACPPDNEGFGGYEIRDLVKNALRMNPDRIVVGECRGGEALDMLQAMNTGHNGSLTTLHANSPRDCISRLEVLSLLSGVEIPIMATRTQIASSIDLIIQQTRFPCGSRRITNISEVSGMESDNVQLGEIFTFHQEGINSEGKITGRFEASGYIPSFYENLRERGISADISIFQ